MKSALSILRDLVLIVLGTIAQVFVVAWLVISAWLRRASAALCVRFCPSTDDQDTPPLND